uniref:Myelin associated glycoprotein n=1 Tax=Astyanax mexicanus TaxID=7994 RepID=A0A8B9K8A2_ASTMX
MKCLELLLPLVLLIRGNKIIHFFLLCRFISIWDISAMTNSCVVIPCTFMYPSAVRPYRGTHGIWYFGQPYPQLFPPVVYKSRTDIVHESYKGRTRLLGDLSQKNCTLQINNVGVEHSGRYYFRADLGGANIYTYPDFTELKVLDQPNIDVPAEIVSDERLDLTCYAPDNCPDMSPEIHWMYTDYLPEPLFTSDYVEESNTAVLASTLTFTPRPIHNGQLLGCRVHFPNTSFVYERLISLDIKYAPRTVWVNVSQEVMEGSSVTLHCDVDSNPAPRISWHFGDEELMSETASNASLFLESLTPEQEGVYTCVGDNGYGAMNTSMYLAVRYPPREPLVNESLTVQEGSTIALHCSTQGNPAPTLTWLKDGELVGTITAEEVNVLELLEITPQVDGTYRCLAENEHGRASSSLNITVEYTDISLIQESSFYFSEKYMMAVIVGTIGGVAVIAFIVAAVRYVGQNNKKENGNPGQDVGSRVENPSMFYSAVKKDKQSLRKKVLKTELLGSKFNSILEESTGDDSDYQSVGSMASLERQELNYAALEFVRGRPREGGFGRGDDGSDYTEIKAK